MWLPASLGTDRIGRIPINPTNLSPQFIILTSLLSSLSSPLPPWVVYEVKTNIREKTGTGGGNTRHEGEEADRMQNVNTTLMLH